MSKAYRPKKVNETFNVFDVQYGKKACNCPCRVIKVFGHYVLAIDSDDKEREFEHKSWDFRPVKVQEK